ncbi:hypothetical protein NSPZN2_70050 [Nitrospira defluvii]|uniref:Transposase n=1 Tax=Nitrospira defluvii TaxID=330214 RepID=A0ABM8S8E3_9BACT|nr:hypothetical protein NSPZN2_70050 [Nitrospira defluvii]
MKCTVSTCFILDETESRVFDHRVWANFLTLGTERCSAAHAISFGASVCRRDFPAFL